MQEDFAKIPIKLSNGSIILAEIHNQIGEQEASSRFFPFADAMQALSGVAEDINTALEKASPNKVTLELGMEFAIESGRLTAMVISGSGRSQIKVALEWHR